MEKSIKAFAQGKGYSNVELLGKWKGHDVYDPVYSGWFGKHGDIRVLILVKKEEMRWTSASEAKDILRDLKID